MHDIEPYYHWRDEYIAEEDRKSPFYRREYNEFSFHNAVYNYYIHPQWDDFGSSTLYIKIIWANYTSGFAIIQLIGEWNDAIHNDIMYLKRNIAEHLMQKGIRKFLLISDNVLNFHGGDTSYYEEWREDVMELGGWIVNINLLEHVSKEFSKYKIDWYIDMGEELNDINWRTMKPAVIHDLIEKILIEKQKNLF